MDKNIIKSFAIESRRQMVESVKYQASLIGITAEGINEPISKAEGMETYDYGAGTFSIFDEDIKKRANLVKEITNKGFDHVLEEVAYTWFNRIIAIRYWKLMIISHQGQEYFLVKPKEKQNLISLLMHLI